MKKTQLNIAVVGAMGIGLAASTTIFDIKDSPLIHIENNDWRGKGKRKMRRQR